MHRKPVIGAINGYVLGGGLEMMLNLDMVFAGTSSIFGLPEVSRGITVGAGGIPRLVRLIGRQKGQYTLYTPKPRALSGGHQQRPNSP